MQVVSKYCPSQFDTNYDEANKQHAKQSQFEISAERTVNLTKMMMNGGMETFCKFLSQQQQQTTSTTTLTTH